MRWVREEEHLDLLPELIASFDAPAGGAQVGDDNDAADEHLAEEDQNDDEEEEGEAEGEEKDSDSDVEKNGDEDDDDDDDEDNDKGFRPASGMGRVNGAGVARRTRSNAPAESNVQQRQHGALFAPPPPPPPRPPMMKIMEGSERVIRAQFLSSGLKMRIVPAAMQPLLDGNSVILRIVGVRKSPGPNPTLEYMCVFAARDGVAQVPRWVPSADVRKHNINLVCDYYEKKVVLVPMYPQSASGRRFQPKQEQE